MYLGTRGRSVASLLVVAGLALAVSTMGLDVPTAAAATLPSGCTAEGVGVTCVRDGLNRVHLIAGNDVRVEAQDRSVSVAVDQTQSLRDRQEVRVNWSGAHPTGGTVSDATSIAASEQEYPMVLMQCRGVDSADAPDDKRMSPATCWTQSPAERAVSSSTFLFPPSRNDRYATAADRQRLVGLPDASGAVTTDQNAIVLPPACAGADAGAQRWVPFNAANGVTYLGGPSGCAGMAPEAANLSSSLQPSNTTYGVTRTDGTGEAKFVINTAESNASLGCSDTVPCSLVAIPILGIGCDIAGLALPRADRVPRIAQEQASAECLATGHFQPGQDSGGAVGIENVSVSGLLWWSESNWQHRITVPLQFAPPSNVCDLVSKAKPSFIYGAQALTQATLQWGPRFCTDPSLFKFQHVQFSEPGARNLLNASGVEAAVVGAPPQVPWSRPTVQAPIAISGFAIAFAIDDAKGREVAQAKLTPRLLAKLMTMSYPALVGIRNEFKEAGDTSTAYYDKKSLYYDPGHSDYLALANNPLDIIADPEFRALNPDMMTYTDGYDSLAASTLYSLSSDSDVMFALTSYINADPDARAWLDGHPDPWGMRVNPRYEKIALPTVSWPVNDTHKSQAAANNDPCLDGEKNVPFLPLVAAPVSNPAVVTLNMQFGIANSQVNCKDAGQPNQKLVSLGRQYPGKRAIFGLVPLADADRYLLSTASLQSTAAADAPRLFTDATGRTFVPPTDAGLKAAVKLLKPVKDSGTWPIPYSTLRTASGAKAYPGTMLLSLAVPTQGLPKADAARYAQFLRFVTTKGQAPGVSNGQLPPGYLPMTAANGAAALVHYTGDAALAISKQQGYVPAVDGSSSPPTPTPTPTPTPSYSSDSGGGTDYGSGDSGGGSTEPPPTTEPTSAPTKAPPTPKPTPTPSPTATLEASAGITAPLPGGGGLRFLPMALGVAAAAGIGAAALAFWGRW